MLNHDIYWNSINKEPITQWDEQTPISGKENIKLSPNYLGQSYYSATYTLQEHRHSFVVL